MDKFKRLTDLVLTAMEDDVKWQKTWQSGLGLHCNWVTNRPYSGMNQITTMINAAIHGYTKPYWLTYKQVNDLGGSVKGQKATPALYFGVSKDKDDPEKSYKFAKLYNLFNIEQTGIDLPAVELRPTKLEKPYELADALNVKINSSSINDPSYIPSIDVIKMPMPGQFISDDAHQSTFYHECIHSTGHSKRLNRPLLNMFGTEEYAKEELVAELGSIFLCADLGVKYDIQQHASYIRSWQKAIKSDSQYLLTAATAARKAHEYCISQLNLMRQQEAA
jgi:antirestriction protein ArdC